MWFFLLERACFIAWKKKLISSKKEPPDGRLGWSSQALFVFPGASLAVFGWGAFSPPQRFLGRLGLFLVANSKEKGWIFLHSVSILGWLLDVVQDLFTHKPEKPAVFCGFFGLFLWDIQTQKGIQVLEGEFPLLGRTLIHSCLKLLLMEEIPNNQLGCIKPCKYGINYQPQLVSRTSEKSTVFFGSLSQAWEHKVVDVSRALSIYKQFQQVHVSWHQLLCI